MKKGPVYTLTDFLEACRVGTNEVYIQKKRALNTAREQLQLLSQEEILKFLGEMTINKLIHCDTDFVEKTSDRPVPEFDAYHFVQGFKTYYLAFYKSALKGQWVLKSLHRDDFQNLENKAFSAPLIELKNRMNAKKDGR